MNVPVSEAKAQLTDLVRRAEAGEEIVLTRNGKPAVRLTAAEVERPLRGAALEAAIREIQAEVAALNLSPGPCAARSQDFLYDENGLPD